MEQTDETKSKNLDAKNDGNDTAKKPEGEVIPKASYDVVAEKLRKANAILERMQKEKEDAERKQQEESGKYKELYESEVAKNQKLVTEQQTILKKSAITSELSKMGAKNPEIASKLLDLDKIELSEEGSIKIESVEAQVKTLLEKEPYLFGKEEPKNIGNSTGGTPENGATTTTTFKRSQLADSKFYAEHEAEIMTAMRNGTIINDINPAQAGQ